MFPKTTLASRYMQLRELRLYTLETTLIDSTTGNSSQLHIFHKLMTPMGKPSMSLPFTEPLCCKLLQ